MQFQVPQFIEVEDKIFGPLTFRQFVYLAGGGGVVVALYVLVPLFFTILLGLPVAALALALAFYKINNRPFVEVVESAFYYITKNKLYLWKKKAKKATEAVVASPGASSAVIIPRLSQSKLKDLAWSLDIKENSRRGQ